MPAVKSIMRYFIKPEQSILVDVNKLGRKSISLTFNPKTDIVQGALLKDKSALIGTAALQLEKDLNQKKASAVQEVKSLFGALDSVKEISSRSKSAISAQTKIEREFMEKGVIESYQDLTDMVRDGIGNRMLLKTLPKLSNKEIDEMVKNLVVNGEKISKADEKLLYKYIYNHNMSKEDKVRIFPIFEKFAAPLIEKQSKEVVDRLTLGIVKYRMLKEGLTKQEILDKGILSKNMLESIDDTSIIPVDFRLFNNYRGELGLPTFTNAQLRQIERASGSKVTIISRPDLLDYDKYPKEIIDDMKKSIRKSGYRTAQMNVVHANGANGEWQFRDEFTNKIAEFEHIAYDLRMGKNTLGEIFNDYKREISKLSDFKYAKYNEYLEECYNYYNRKALGLPAKKPILPKGFKKVLSIESLENLYNKDHARKELLEKNFEPYFEMVA